MSGMEMMMPMMMAMMSMMGGDWAAVSSGLWMAVCTKGSIGACTGPGSKSRSGRRVSTCKPHLEPRCSMRVVKICDEFGWIVGLLGLNSNSKS